MPNPRRFAALLLGCLGVIAVTSGCRSPYRADQGALFGGLTGAGVGAIIGNQSDNAGAGAASGAAVGSLTGAVVGEELDQIEAQNRAAIEQQLGRQVRAGAVTMEEIITMSQSGVGESLIVNHIRAHGVVAPPTSADLITLKQAGVPDGVVAVMQNPPQPATKVVPVAAPAPVIVEEHHYGWPGWHGRPYRRHYHHRHHRPGRVHWGVTVGG
ncbi:MAG: glycine zipper domain-containing protein [Pirellulales bacterium]|nr:glycine zipper domain-containing protein [Pirellulales bacterium]